MTKTVILILTMRNEIAALENLISRDQRMMSMIK